MGRISTMGGWAIAAAAALAAAPAQAELINAQNPQVIKTIVESQGWPAKIVSTPGESPYIESSRDGLKFLVLFMNCDDAGKACKTLQFYMGFNDAKSTTLERLNEWNSGKRFGRAYRDESGDPVLEMDVDLDYDGIPRANLGEAFNTWAALMDAYHAHIYPK